MKETRNKDSFTSEASKTDATFEASRIPQSYEQKISKLLSQTKKKGVLTRLLEWVFSTPETQQQRRPLTQEERQRLQDEEDEDFEEEQDEDSDYILGGAW